MKQICIRILGIETTFTTKVEDFIKHTGPKITYTKQPLQNEFFVRSNDLLFEQGINDLDISISDWEGTPCFFLTDEKSALPFDIFSASFYLLTRYEEYLPHVKDIHDRFSPKDSIAYQNDFLKLPIVDIWAFKFLEKLKERFPQITYKKRDYSYTSIIDVTTSHCFSHRGFVRSIAGFLLDFSSLSLRRVAKRIVVWFVPKKDPYNNFDYLVNTHKKNKVHSMFFFQFASYSTYDKNVSPNNNKFQYLIKSIADYSIVSLTASYSSFYNTSLLKNEKKKLATVINRPVNYSRMRYNRVDIPQTYRNLVKTEFTDDYTMGYTHEIGFRAGTCTPFYFYDIALEVQQPIRVHSFAVHDYALLNVKNKDEIISTIETIYRQVKSVNGNFISIFSNELLGDSHKVVWKELYEAIIKRYNE